MFDAKEIRLLLSCVLREKAALERSKAKARDPEFGPIYDKMLGEVAALAMKLQEVRR